MSAEQDGPVELNGTALNGGGLGITNGAPEEATTNGTATTPGGGGGSDAGGTGGQSTADAGCSDGPPSIIGVGPPSPLTGCYLLIIIGEPHSQDHKDIILQRLIKGFLSWDVSDCHVDLEEELHTITLQALEGEEGKHGERLIQYASENLVTEILIHPQINTFIQCIRNLLSSFTRHRHIIHTGYTFAANGSWVLQDGTFSVLDFMEAFQEHEVQRILRAYPDTITMDLHCAPAGNWAMIQDKSFARLCRVRLNPVDVLSSGSDRLNAFVDYLASMIVPTEIAELLESSDVVGNIRFSHPTLYVFPGGQGDAALFGINGFNMLVDGGFSRKSCFWDFVRHLDRLDAVLMTRINNTNIKGISAVVERKHEAHVYPQIGHFFCNIPERKNLLSPDGDKDRDPLLVDLIEEGHQIVTNLKSLNLKAQNCYRDTEPINLYHKVGHGTLDMYVISPAKDSKEVKEFLAKWNAADPKLFTPKSSKEFTFPIQNIISICALLVWTPANPEDNITRILFPGSAPEYKILEGLEKMKNVEFMRHPVCSVKSIAPSISTQVLTKKSLKSSSIDKIIPEPILPSKVTKPSEKDNKILDNKLKMIDNKLADAAKSSSDMMDSSADEAKTEKQITKSAVSAAKVDVGKSKASKTKSIESIKKIDSKLIESSKRIERDEKKDSTSDAGSEKDETEKKVVAEEVTAEKAPDVDSKEDEPKELKKDESPTAKEESKLIKKTTERAGRPATARSRIDTKPPKVTKTIKKKDETNKSSPTTPKKTVEPKMTNGITEKKDDEPKKAMVPAKTAKPILKTGKLSPKGTPAKSAKDANNRKVLEARQRPVPKPQLKKDSSGSVEKKESPPKVERKPISRRPKGASVGTVAGGSPVKAKKVLKSEKDAVIRKAKLDKNGTTDSSLVSTPSADEAGVVVQKRIVDTSATATTTDVSDVDTIEQRHLAELKEEQEAVREIEAVFKRDSEKAKHRELLPEHREVQDSTTEPEEEEEYLIIEKEEQYTEDSINEPESSATKEEEIQKHQRDSEESEKRKRDSSEGEKEEKGDATKVEAEEAAVIEIIEGNKEGSPEGEVQEGDKDTAVEKEAVEKVKEDTKEDEKMSPKHKQDLEEEVQDIIASAKEIAKSKMETSMDGLKTEEMSSISPDEKMSSTKKTSDTRDENEQEPAPKGHIEPPHESHHEERISATAESGATTTAPTLPEDERIPLDEIKEDLVIEEKYVKEETKEVEVAPPLPTVYEPLERPTPAKMQFNAQQAHMRDVVKTPDEVADLPMHEEVDFEEYSEDKDKADEKDRDTKEKPEAAATTAQKETEAKEPEKTDKVVADKSAESDKLCDTVKDAQKEVQEVVEKVEKNNKVDKPPKLDTQSSLAKGKLDEATTLQDLESQIIPRDAIDKKEIETVASVKPVDKVTTKREEKQEPQQEDDDDKKSVHEEEIVAKHVDPKVPAPAQKSILEEIWATPVKAEEKLEELKQMIDDKAKETTSDLVAVKDEMVKQVAGRKDEILDKVQEQVAAADSKLKETVDTLCKEAETVANDAIEGLTAKADSVTANLQTKTQEIDEKLATGVESITAKAEQIMSTITAEKKQLEQLSKDIKEEVAEKLDETKKQLEDDLSKKADQVQDQTKGVSAFFSGITEELKSGIEKIAEKVETTIQEKTDQVESKLQEVTDKIEELKTKEVVEESCQKKEIVKVPSPEPVVPADTYSYERGFTQELRETHITTIDSPVSDADKIGEIKSIVNIPQHIDEDKELEDLEASKMAGTFVIEDVKYSTFEDANLRDIKEEEEEDRVTPPQKDDRKSSPKLEATGPPPRARTPEDVAKIVANVAEVLKSDKDLEEIIPGFDPQELERKLSQGAPREEDIGTVQRMLVTASSEDGGEETVICPDGTITFSKTVSPSASGKTTPEIKIEEDSLEQKTIEESTDKPSLPEATTYEKSSPASSGKSSPDVKTSPTSIEEKDKHELPEKAVIETKKTPEKTSADRTESTGEQYDHMDDSRRESAISTFSERDYTKDESSIVDERDSSRAHSISSHVSDLKEDIADAKSIAEFLKDVEKEDDKQDVFTDNAKQKVDPAAKKAEDLSSPESVASQQTVSETSVAVKIPSDEKPTISADSITIRPVSAASHASDKDLPDISKPEETQKTHASRPESAASHLSEKETTEVSLVPEKDVSRPESVASDKAAVPGKAEVKLGSQEASRPESAASHVSDVAAQESLVATQDTKDGTRPESVTSHTSDKISLEKDDHKLEPGSVSKESSRPGSVTSHTSEPKVDGKDSSRPVSATGHITEDVTHASSHDKQETKPEQHLMASPSKTDQKDKSRPESVASHVSEKSISEKMDSADQKAISEQDATDKETEKAPSRPESVASHVSETAPSTEKVSAQVESAASQKISAEKDASRPESVASHGSEKLAQQGESRPHSVLSDKSTGPVEKTPEHGTSRPESAASHVSEKAASTTMPVEEKISTSLANAPEQIASQPQSSHASEETVTDKQSVVEKLDTTAEKDTSRPESAASHASEKAASETLTLAEKADKSEKTISRPESAASHVSEKAPSEKSTTAEQATSRPASAASHVSEKASSDKSTTAEQATSRPESATSHASEKATSDKPDQASSRPESATSHASEKVLSDKSSVEVKTSEKGTSRPESAASHVSEAAPLDKTTSAEKASVMGGSRPASAASHVSDKVEAEPKQDDKQDPKDAPASASATSDSSEKASKPLDKQELETTTAETTDKDAESKETSRPESAASEKQSSKNELKPSSRPESSASHTSDKDAQFEPVKEDTKEGAAVDRPASTASHTSEKDSFKTSEQDKEPSRPISAASHVSEKALTDKSPVLFETEKSASRPESVASTKTQESDKASKEDTKDEKSVSRPESASSHVSEKDKTQSGTSDAEKAASRPDSVVSHTSEKSPATETKSSSEQPVDEGYSRPESPASCGSDKAISPAKAQEYTHVEKDLARPDSAASYHGEPIPDEKEFSRPESPASCEEDHAEQVKPGASAQSEAIEDVAHGISPPAGITADAKSLPEESTKDAMDSKTSDGAVSGSKTPEETGKEFSRPESPASCGSEVKDAPTAATQSRVPEKDLARPDSAASYHGEPIPDEKPFSRPSSPPSFAEDTTTVPKEPSRPESAASGKAASEKEASRPGSVTSIHSDKEKQQVEVTQISEMEKLRSVQDTSRPESAASHVSDKSATKDERPSSGLSDHGDEIDAKIFVKESRSKSLSSVMAAGGHKTGFDGSALGVLEEGIVTSRDDLHVLKTPRESITKLEGLAIQECKIQKSESRINKPLFGPSHFPSEDKPDHSGFPTSVTDHESPDQTDSILPGMDLLLKETAASMKEIEKMSSSVISMIKSSEKKEESVKVDDKGASLAFPILDSGKSTPLSTEKDKSQTSSIKSASPHDKDSLEESSASLNTFIEKDSLSESASKQVTIKMTTIEEPCSKDAAEVPVSKHEAMDLLSGAKTPPTAPISPNVIKDDFGMDHHTETTITSSTVTTIGSASQMVKQHKDDVSGISTPKESVPSGRSSPGMMSVHTGSTDSASKSINLGHSSGIETSESSPKPTSPFPKIVDNLKADDVKTSSGMSTPDMTRTSTPDMVDSQIERIPEEKKDDTQSTILTTTTTKTTRFIIKDGEKIEVGSHVKTETSSDVKKDDTSSGGVSLSSPSVTTTTKVIREIPKTPANLTLASTEDRSFTEEFDEKEGLSPRSDISSGQASRIVAGWHDEDVPGSPMSMTSQGPLSPSTKYTYDYDLQHSSSGVSKKSEIEIDDSQDEIPPQYGSDEVKSAITIASAYNPDPMSTSFYGQLPDISDSAVTTTTTATKSVPIPITAAKGLTKSYMEYASSGDSSVDSSHHKPAATDRKYLDEADLDFEKVFTKSDKVDLMTTSMHFASEKEFMAATTTVAPSAKSAETTHELDFTASGLPSTSSPPQAQTTTTGTVQSGATTVSTTSSSQTKTEQDKDPLAAWGKPLGLPSPAPLNDDNMKTTPKKERRMILSKTRLNNEKNLRKRSESPIKGAKKPAPVYVDLSYVPHHGNSYYANVDFFKRVRARYYVFSGTEPSREVYNALLEAKQTWEDKELEVTIIPTYDTDVLGYWVSENEDLLAKYHIDLSPSAARCTINLQDHETSCSAYRLEF